ncbi:MAG: hypothetical protein OQK29_11160, partial [Ignavibacteriaceae bacterium]|nr:hypothetical protein [Ignavibacteriaceae bacterium]
KIGCVSGKSSRLNERIIDHIWLDFLGEYSQLVKIPPFTFIKLFGGSIRRWSNNFPQGLDSFIEK